VGNKLYINNINDLDVGIVVWMKSTTIPTLTTIYGDIKHNNYYI